MPGDLLTKDSMEIVITTGKKASLQTIGTLQTLERMGPRHVSS